MEGSSWTAFRDLVDSGRISGRRRTVLVALWINGPSTARELCQETGNHSDQKRLNELQRMRLVEVLEERECRVTGRQAKVWQLTGLKAADMARIMRNDPPREGTCGRGRGRKLRASDPPSFFLATASNVPIEGCTNEARMRAFCKEHGYTMLTFRVAEATDYPAPGTASIFNQTPLFPEGAEA